MGGRYKIVKYRNSNGDEHCTKSIMFTWKPCFGHACPLNSVWGPGSYRAVLNTTAFDTLFMGSHAGCASLGMRPAAVRFVARWVIRVRFLTAETEQLCVICTLFFPAGTAADSPINAIPATPLAQWLESLTSGDYCVWAAVQCVSLVTRHCVSSQHKSPL